MFAEVELGYSDYKRITKLWLKLSSVIHMTEGKQMLAKAELPYSDYRMFNICLLRLSSVIQIIEGVTDFCHS